jgi:DNA integrity scanning protein DisA with diadenylate cyclase activity
MKVMQMLNSIPVLEKLMTLSLPVVKAHKIYSLTKQINEQREFFINEEKKMIEKFSVTIDSGNLHFKSSEDQALFVAEHNELMQYQVEGLMPIELSFTDLGNLEITPMEMSSLDGVVIFID